MLDIAQLALAWIVAQIDAGGMLLVFGTSANLDRPVTTRRQPSAVTALNGDEDQPDQPSAVR
jgi:hypothetical protein